MLQRSKDSLSRPFDSEYEKLLKSFNGRPIRVDFRDLVGNSSAAERFTHRFHPYPAKLLLNIPLFFLNCSQLLRSNGIVYDPFCGSGTVLVEALVRDAVAIGADSNPLARLITLAKTTPVSNESIEAGLEKIWRLLPRRQPPLPQGPIDLSKWFFGPVRNKLNRLRVAIQNLSDGPEKVFFQVCFSAPVHQVSLADPTVPVPVMINPGKATLSQKQKK